MGTIEHRRLFRAEVFTKISYETIKPPFVKGRAVTVDVSSIGIHMIGAERLEAGTELLLKIFFESRKTPISATAKVIWQKECMHQPNKKKVYYACGLMLLDMAPQDAILTSDYIFDAASKHQLSCEKQIIQQLQGKG
ncbi:MAG: PilZ domain-containing protein [Candidatus Omnitrophota bacterium]